MNHQPGPDAPAHYELRIEGHLDEHWSAWFGGLTLIPEDDGTTTLRGPVTDLHRLRHLMIPAARCCPYRALRRGLTASRPDATISEGNSS
jgi:hypothetical protein